MIEGVDFSATSWSGSPSVQALNAAGKKFVGRYAVGDKSPGGRGIHAAEYGRYVEAGIDVFLYWQTTTNWMLGGWDAGVQGAKNAQFNIANAGMPPETPVYFACDFDAQPSQMRILHDCLRGAASVLGKERVGVYGGWAVIDACSKAETARWFCQTSAWSQDGHGNVVWHPAAHLHQYAYNAWIDGTNMDLVRATVANYGQAIPPDDPPPPPVHRYADPVNPAWWADSLKDPHPTDRKEGKVAYRVARRAFVCKVLTTRRSEPKATAKNSGPKVDVNEKIFGERIVTVPGQKGYWIKDAEGHHYLGSKFSPSIAIEPW